MWSLPMIYWTLLCRGCPSLDMTLWPGSLWTWPSGPALSGHDPLARLSLDMTLWPGALWTWPSGPALSGHDPLARPADMGPYCTGTPAPPPRHVPICTLWSTCNWQAGGSHPTGMLVHLEMIKFLCLSFRKFSKLHYWSSRMSNRRHEGRKVPGDFRATSATIHSEICHSCRCTNGKATWSPGSGPIISSTTIAVNISSSVSADSRSILLLVYFCIEES